MTGSLPPSSPELVSGPLTLTTTASSLPLSTRLEEFELTGVLGEGGFSVVYIALDHSLGRTVAIKEYMPSAIATRLPDGSVLPKSARHEETFKAGLTSFLNEARLLARFSHPALIHIHRIWEQNGTAYMAMQYCLGQTLRQIKQSEPALVRDEGWLKIIFAPILDALEVLHAQNCFHRDISPDNILVLQNGKPVLLDFGAARQVIGDMTQALTVILRPGFAPIEQYADDSSLQQGAWTDIYGVGAVLYYLLMGKPPVASVARLVKDPMGKLADADELADISRTFRQAIDLALAVYPNQRIQSIADFREMLQLPTLELEWPSGETLLAHAGAGTARDAARSPAEERASISPAPNMDSQGQAEMARPDVAKIGNGSKTSWLQTIFLGIGTAAVALGALFGFLHKPAATTQNGTGVIVNQTATEKPSELPPVASVPPPQQTITPANREVATVSVITASQQQDRAPADQGSSSPTAGTAPVASDSPQAQHTDSSADAKIQTETKNNSSPANIPETSAKPVITPASEEVTTISTMAASQPQDHTPTGTGSSPTASTTPAVKNNPKTQHAGSSAGAKIQTETKNNSSPANTPKTSAKPVKASEKPAKTSSAPHAPASQAGATSSPKPPEAESTQAKEKQQTAIPSVHSASTPGAVSHTVASSPDKARSFVRLSIKPWGQISVDGQARGVSPPLTHLSLPPGEHVIVITNGDFPTVTVPVTVPEKGDVVVHHKFGTKQ